MTLKLRNERLTSFIKCFIVQHNIKMFWNYDFKKRRKKYENKKTHKKNVAKQKNRY